MKTRKELLQEAVNRGPDVVNSLNPSLQRDIERALELGIITNPFSGQNTLTSNDTDPRIFDNLSKQEDTEEIFTNNFVNISNQQDLQALPEDNVVSISNQKDQQRKEIPQIGAIMPNFLQGLKDFGGEIAKLVASVEGSSYSLPIGTGLMAGAVPNQYSLSFLPSNREEFIAQDKAARENIIQAVEKQRKEYNALPISQGTGAKISRVFGQVAPTLFLPTGSGVSGFFKRLGATSAIGAGSGFIMPTDDVEDSYINDQRLINTFMGSVLGPSGVVLGKGFDVASDFAQNFTNLGGRLAIKKQIQPPLDPDKVAKTTQAAKELDTFVTPGELAYRSDGSNPLIVRTEQQLDLSANQQLRLDERLIDREQKVGSTLDALISKLRLSDAEANFMAEGYNALRNIKYTPTFINKIKNDEVLGPLYTNFLKDRTQKIELNALRKEFGTDTLFELELFKRYAAKQSSNARKALDPKDRDASFARLIDQRLYGRVDDTGELIDAGLVPSLESLVPEYAVANQLFKYKAAHNNIFERMSKIKGATLGPHGDRVVSPIQFYDEFMASNKSYNELADYFKGMPQALKKLEQVRVMLSAIKSSPLKQAFTQDSVDTVARGGAFGRYGAAVDAALRPLRGKFMTGIIDYITDPRWSDDLLEESATAVQKIGSEDISALAQWLGTTGQQMNRFILGAQGGTGYKDGEVGMQQEE